MKISDYAVPVLFIVLLAIGVVALINQQDKKYKQLESEISYIETHYEEKVINTCSRKENIDTSFFLKHPKEGLMEALIYLNIPHPEIVYAQAVLETGWFKSHGYTKKNNLFGIYKGNTLRKYNTWEESVRHYKELFSDRYKDPNESYFVFLERVNYAEDPRYTIKLKQILKEL